MPATETLFTIGAILGIAESLDNAIKAHNIKKANQLKKELDSIINRTNMEASIINNELNKAGLDYNDLMSRLQGVSRAGSGFQAQEQATKDYKDMQRKAKTALNKISLEQAAAQEMYQPDIDRLSNQGAIQTVLEPISNVFNKIIK